MPFRRRRSVKFGKRTKRYKRRYPNRRASNRDIINLKKSIRRHHRDEELNHQYTTYLSETVDGAPDLDAIDGSSAGILTRLTNIDQGDARFQRIGDKLRVTSVQGNLIFLQNTGTISDLLDDAWNYVRVILFKTKAGSDINPNISADFILNETTDTVANVLAQYKSDQHRQYKIYYDKTFLVSGPAAGTAGTNERQWLPPHGSKRLKFKKRLNVVVPYADATNTATGNEVYLLMYSSSSAAPNPLVIGTLRTNWKED